MRTLLTIVVLGVVGCAEQSISHDRSDIGNNESFEDVTDQLVVPLSEAPDRRLASIDKDTGDLEGGRLPTVVGQPKQMHELSELEIAEGLRSVIYTSDGRVLRERSNAVNLAKIAKNGGDKEVVVDGSPGALGVLDLPSEKAPSYIFDGAGNVGSDDNRTIPTQAAPWTQIVHLSSGCSGMYMGDRTVITAAHCVIANNGSKISNIRITPYKKGPGTVAPDSPYGSHVVAATSQLRVTSGYLNAQIAARNAGHVADNGIIYDEGMMVWDFAVIEFASGARPTPMANVGWNGFAVNGFTDGAAKIYGYPGSGCPGSSVKPRLCGMGGYAYSNGIYLETEVIDMTGGQSGGPWLRYSNHMVGINIADNYYRDFGRCGFDPCYRNIARRLDDVVWGWVQTWSPDW